MKYYSFLLLLLSLFLMSGQPVPQLASVQTLEMESGREPRQQAAKRKPQEPKKKAPSVTALVFGIAGLGVMVAAFLLLLLTAMANSVLSGWGCGSQMLTLSGLSTAFFMGSGVGLIALILALLALRQIRKFPNEYEGGHLAKIAAIMGAAAILIGLGLGLAFLLF